jgi:hypothetical protein
VCDVWAGEALPAQGYDALLDLRRGWSPELGWPGGPIRQPGRGMDLEALDPPGDRLEMDAERGCHGFARSMLIDHPAHQFGSTVRR